MTYTGEEELTDAPTDRRFVCAVCERTFESEAALERHVHDAGLLY